MNFGKDYIEQISNKFRAAQDAAESMMAWQAQQAAEKHQREIEAAEDIRRLAEDSQIARQSAATADRKANIAIVIAVLSMVLTVVAICVAHYDSEQTSKAIVSAIQSLKGEQK